MKFQTLSCYLANRFPGGLRFRTRFLHGDLYEVLLPDYELQLRVVRVVPGCGVSYSDLIIQGLVAFDKLTDDQKISFGKLLGKDLAEVRELAGKALCGQYLMNRITGKGVQL